MFLHHPTSALLPTFERPSSPCALPDEGPEYFREAPMPDPDEPAEYFREAPMPSPDLPASYFRTAAIDEDLDEPAEYFRPSALDEDEDEPEEYFRPSHPGSFENETAFMMSAVVDDEDEPEQYFRPTASYSLTPSEQEYQLFGSPVQEWYEENPNYGSVHVSERTPLNLLTEPVATSSIGDPQLPDNNVNTEMMDIFDDDFQLGYPQACKILGVDAASSLFGVPKTSLEYVEAKLAEALADVYMPTGDFTFSVTSAVQDRPL